jgi:hypothetical protein
VSWSDPAGAPCGNLAWAGSACTHVQNCASAHLLVLDSLPSHVLLCLLPHLPALPCLASHLTLPHPHTLPCPALPHTFNGLPPPPHPLSWHLLPACINYLLSRQICWHTSLDSPAAHISPTTSTHTCTCISVLHLHPTF